jgi:hypothetical protein
VLADHLADSVSIRKFPLAHARKAPQLYKKRASFRPSVQGIDVTGLRCGRIEDGLVRSVLSMVKQALIRLTVNALDFTGVRCLRMVYGLSSIRKPLRRGGAEARTKMGLTRAQQRSFDFAPTARPTARRGRRGRQDFACGFPPSTALRVTPAKRLKMGLTRAQCLRGRLRRTRQIPRLSSGFRLRGSRFGFRLAHARKTAQRRRLPLGFAQVC